MTAPFGNGRDQGADAVMGMASDRVRAATQALAVDWTPDRKGLARSAVGAAIATAVAAIVVSRNLPAALFNGFVFSGTTVMAVLVRKAVVVQMVMGVVLVWASFVTSDALNPGVVVVIAGVVLACELAGATAEFRVIVPRDPGPEVRRAFIASLFAAGVSGAVVGVAALPGPTGVASTALAALGVLIAAVMLGR